MADLDSFTGDLNEQAERETIGLMGGSNMYMAQHWGIRQAQNVGTGFSSEAATESLLGGLQMRIDIASKPKTDYVGLVDKVDVRKDDHFTVFIGSKKYKLTVSKVTSRGSASEVELKRG
jgi:hypothetical protein